jgi:hypothetical protein
LIAHGHRHGDILDYTLGQFYAYVRHAMRRDSDLQLAQRAQVLAPFYAARGGSVKPLLDALDHATHPAPPNPTRRK